MFASTGLRILWKENRGKERLVSVNKRGIREPIGQYWVFQPVESRKGSNMIKGEKPGLWFIARMRMKGLEG